MLHRSSLLQLDAPPFWPRPGLCAFFSPPLLIPYLRDKEDWSYQVPDNSPKAWKQNEVRTISFLLLSLALAAPDPSPWGPGSSERTQAWESSPGGLLSTCALIVLKVFPRCLLRAGRCVW